MTAVSPDFVVARRYKCELLLWQDETGWSGWASDLQQDRTVWLQVLSQQQQQAWVRAQRTFQAQGVLESADIDTDGSLYVVVRQPRDAWVQLNAVGVGLPISLEAAVTLTLRCGRALEELSACGLVVAASVDESLIVTSRGHALVAGHVLCGRSKSAYVAELIDLLERLAGQRAERLVASMRAEMSAAPFTLAEMNGWMADARAQLLSGPDGQARLVRTNAQLTRLAAPRPARSRWRSRTAAALTLVLALTLAGGGAVRLAAQRQFPVPDARGAVEQDASDALEAGGWNVHVSRTESRLPAGQVIDQRPAAGSMLQRDRTVRLTVSLGPKLTDVPDVRDLLAAEAEWDLQALNLRTSLVEVPEGQPGRVLRTEPPAGTGVLPGTTVVIFYGQPSA